MGIYADDAVDMALNGYWGDDPYEGDDADWAPYSGRRWRLFRHRPLRKVQRTNDVVFAAYAAKTIDYGEF